MAEHLTEEKLEQLAAYNLQGNELLAALMHLETCDDCYHKLPKPSVDRIIERLTNPEEKTANDKITHKNYTAD